MFKDLFDKRPTHQSAEDLIKALKDNVKQKEEIIRKLVDDLVERNLTVKKLCAELDQYKEGEEIPLDDLVFEDDEPDNVP